MASYFVALMFIVLALADILTNAWPWDFGSEQWRFGMVGIASNYLMSIIFGLLLAALTAALAEHRQVLRVVAGLTGAGVVILMLLAFTFSLDTIQVRVLVSDERRQLFKIGAVKTLFKVLASVAAFAMVCVGSVQARRLLGARFKAKPAAPLVRES